MEPKPPAAEGIAVGVVSLVRNLLGVDAALVERYAPWFQRLATPEDPDGKGKPDYSKPGQSGSYSNPDRVHVWDDTARPSAWGTEIDVTRRAPDCGDLTVAAWYGEAVAACPPPRGFLPLLQKAEAKAIDEAKKVPCPAECPEQHVEVVHRAWQCRGKTRALVVVHARRTCLVGSAQPHGPEL